MECPLQNDGEALQGPFVTVTQEEWDSSTEIVNDKQREKKRCDKRARQLDRGQRILQKLLGTPRFPYEKSFLLSKKNDTFVWHQRTERNPEGF